MFYLAMFSCHPIFQHLSRRVPKVPCSACSEHRPWTLRTDSGQGAGMWQKRKGGGGAERLCREAAGREVAEDKEQGRPGGMILTDPRAPGVGTLWLRAGYSLVSQLGVSSRVPLSTFFQETSLCFLLFFFLPRLTIICSPLGFLCSGMGFLVLSSIASPLPTLLPRLDS